jgi:dipeptidyl aminopeptidase/acylaminoacyl peptidase
VFRLRLGAGTPAEPLIAGPDRVVQGLSVAPGGDVAAVIATADSPGDVYRTNVQTPGEPRRVTQLNSDLLDEIEVVRPVARTFRAPDGLEFEGYIWGGEQGARKPLLLNVHGGPHNAWTPALSAFELHHQELVTDGWCVLAINPRGSDGYGEAFMKAVVGGWGSHDEQDFTAAVDALVADGTADPERLAVTGYSYGGFMTTWLCGHTDRFRCGVAGGAVTNIASEYGTSDLGGHMADAEYGADPHADPELYRRLSPLTRVADIAAPLLILHGERDDRCDLGQAEELFTALRRLRREVQMVIYPGSSHLFVVNGRPSYQVDYQRRLLAWLRAHVPAEAVVPA